MNGEFRIRRATMNDAQLLFEWRNDVETRAQSRASEPVEWEHHVRWLERSLGDARRLLCIAEVNGTPVGTARADFRDDGYAEISYTIAPSARGKGFGTRMMRTFVREYLAGKNIAAEIKQGHAPSESVARALGLSPFSTTPSANPDDPRPIVEWR